MNRKMIERGSTGLTLLFVVLTVAACAIRLRGNEDQIGSSVSADQTADPLVAKLAECRSVTYEQKEALAECRKAWAEKRRQFLGQRAPSTSPDSEASREGSSLFAPQKGESRLPSGFPSVPQSKE